MNNVTFVVAIVLACFILSMLSERLTPEYFDLSVINKLDSTDTPSLGVHDTSSPGQWNNYYDQVVEQAGLKTVQSENKLCFPTAENPGYDKCTLEERDGVGVPCETAADCGVNNVRERCSFLGDVEDGKTCIPIKECVGPFSWDDLHVYGHYTKYECPYEEDNCMVLNIGWSNAELYCDDI